MAWTINNDKYKPGNRFGYITLIKDTGKRSRNGSKIFLCECTCGKRFIRSIESITNSIRHKCIISCGCKKPSYDIGKKYQYDKERIERSKASLGMLSGTTMQGIQRKKLNKNNTSGYRGVSWSNKYKKWKASIMICRKVVGTKYFEKLEDAVKHRQYLEDTFFKPFIDEYEAQNGKYRKEKQKGK